MTTAKDPRRVYAANIACGDISEAEEARMLAEIAAAEVEEDRAFLRAIEQRAAQAA